MSFEEKRTWIYAFVTTLVSGAYFLIIGFQLQGTAITEIPYVRTMLTTSGISIALTVVMNIGAGLLSPKEAGIKDERDTEIHQRGDYFGGFALIAGALGGMGLAMAEFEHFWIANAIFSGFALMALLSSVVKIAAYRRGY